MPRILRVLTGRVLVCGCLVGVYETYDGAIVHVLDARSERCTDARHLAGTAVDAGSGGALAPPAKLLAT
jgi:hypothetical protein